MTLNDILCTYRSVSLLAIVREASFCSRWESIQRPTTGQCAESERFWSTQLWMGCLPSGLQELWETGGRENERPKGDGQFQGHSVFRHRRIHTRVNSQRLWQHKLCIGEIGQGPSTEEDAISDWHKLPRENLVFFNWISQIYWLYLKVGSTSNNRGPT